MRQKSRVHGTWRVRHFLSLAQGATQGIAQGRVAELVAGRVQRKKLEKR